jgi:RND family efflux transporter MFP subunit
MSRRSLHVPLLLAALSGLVLAGCSDEEVGELDLRPAVSVTQVSTVELAEEIRASGELKALYHTTIAAEIEGRVTEIRIEEGLPVEAGAVVVAIDPERRRLERDAARARLARANATLRRQRSQSERVRKLGEQNIASEDQIEEAETALLLASANADAERATFAEAERALKDASVSAPFGGYVARRSVQLGEFVQKGTALFELVALDPLEAEFSVPELDANRVREGLEAQVVVGSLPDRSFRGVVKFVSPTIDRDTRTLRIRAEIENDEGVLRPGLFASVTLGVDERRRVTVVPEEAVVQRVSGALLYKVLADQRVQRVRVRTGSVQDGMVEIIGDVRPGETVVRRGPGGLTDGAVVRVVEQSVPKPALAEAGAPTGAGS